MRCWRLAPWVKNEILLTVTKCDLLEYAQPIYVSELNPQNLILHAITGLTKKYKCASPGMLVTHVKEKPWQAGEEEGGGGGRTCQG